MSNQSATINAWRAVAGLALILAALRLLSLSAMGPSAVVMGVVGLGWLVYQLLEPFHLLRSRAYLREVYVSDSGVRRFFWRANLRRAGLAIGTLVTAALALVTMDSLADYEWVLLVASLPVFGLVLLGVDKRFGRHWQERHRFHKGLLTAYWFTLLMLAGAVVAWQIFIVEVPVTTHLTWQQVLTQAFEAKSSEAAIPLVGWLLGFEAAATDGAWHLMQIAHIGGESGRWIYLGSCVVLLAWNALKLGSVWLVLLGVIVISSRSRMGQHEATSRWASNATFLVILGAALVILHGFTGPIGRLPVWLAGPAQSDSHTWRTSDLCAELRTRQRLEVSQSAAQETERQHSELDARLLALLDERVDVAFSPAEHAVDRFLDWNFSIEGQYAQLGHLAASAVGSNTFEDYMAGQVDSYVHQALDPALAEAEEDVRGELEASIRAAYQYQDAFVGRLMAEARCLQVPQPTVRLEDHMQKSLVGAGVGAGIISTRFAKRVGAKMVTRTAVKRVLSAVAAKGVTRTATTAKSAAAGLVCGPYVFICGPVFAAAAWFGTDAAINLIDETLHRDEMRAEMLEVIEAEKVALKEELRTAYLEASARAFAELREYQAARFNIYRDGG